MIIDAIHFSGDQEVATTETLPYVLSMPRKCPCGDVWLLLLDEPMALEVELGRVGQDHLALLEKHLSADCSTHHTAKHIRSDGVRAWAIS